MIFTEDPAFDSRKTIMHKAMTPKDMTGHAQSKRPAAIRPLDRARCPRLTRGWTPSETSRPWQDRRMLIGIFDQHLAILRMVFLFLGGRPFVNP
ncbi:hypothetical protein [Bradyrhizobium sp.]|uniref:hypothetical protein n=1 Tax=Bradyrhizobium sp. TaxID=376 RepID=UPI001DA10986|nr:hypothetical protein [Bradyrhizobium sp.]MBI5323346.1 hypothetical protein [Bradyrhizobium sp.]